MAPSIAETQGYERASKYPKSTKYGRQNPISARWNSEEQLVLWRAAWADMTNQYLERSGRNERVDHRSHAERGLDEQPTIHEGVTARTLERKGIVSDRCELNRQIRADNALIRTLKATIATLKKAVETTIPSIAAAMESIRQNIIVFNYGLLHVRDRRKEIKIKIAELSEEIGELQFEEKSIMRVFDKADAAGMKEVEGEISKSDARLALRQQMETAAARGRTSGAEAQGGSAPARAINIDAVPKSC